MQRAIKRPGPWFELFALTPVYHLCLLLVDHLPSFSQTDPNASDSHPQLNNDTES